MFIRRSEAIEIVRSEGVRGEGYSDAERIADVVSTLEAVPTAAVCPVGPGVWEKNRFAQTVCSVCHTPIPGYWSDAGVEGNCVWVEIEPTSHCPACGVLMGVSR